ncbi:MAG: TonB-dependent receptor [Pseudomonadota bacterium]
MQNRNIRWSAKLLVAAAIAAPPVTSVAQQGESFAIEEITVTARRVSESLQETPVSITAFSQEGLEARQIYSLEGVADFTPALTINSSSAFSGSSQTVSVFLRGVGQTDFTMNTDPGVGIYVDDVYLSRSVGGLLDLVDVQRVEVLRGPQGTLFGRNSVGGAINITTVRPAEEFGARIYGTAGSDSWYLGGASVDVPLADNFLTKLSLQYQERDGYVKRTTDGKELGDKDNFSGRLSALWSPTDRLEFFFNADYTRSRENGVPLNLITAVADASFPAAHNIIVAPQINPALAPFPNGCLDPEGAIVGGTACYNSQWETDANSSSTDGGYPVYSNLDVWGAAITASYEINSALTIKSVTAYRDLDSEFSREGDGSPLDINATEDIFEYHQWSEELQLIGNAFDGRLNYIIGGFWFEEDGENPNTVDFGYVRFLSGGDIRNTSIAAFGQATYDLTDKWAVTAGIRYTEEKKRFTPNQFIISTYNVPFFPPFLNFTPGEPLTTSEQQSTTTSEYTPRFDISYQITDNSMVYAGYSKGFKSGGFTQRIFPALPEPPSFEPETLDSVEAGFKLDLWDNRLRLNGAAYFNWYDDLQVTVPVGVAPTTQNAAEAEIKGFELEVTVLPTEGMTVHFGAGYIDAEYTELDDRVSPTITEDNEFPGTPEWTLNGSVSYDFALGDGYTLTPRVDWSYRSDYFFDAENFVGQDSYDLYNASIALVNDVNGWSARVFGKNLADEDYLLHGEQILEPAGFAMVSPARGREWGISLDKRF